MVMTKIIYNDLLGLLPKYHPHCVVKIFAQVSTNPAGVLVPLSSVTASFNQQLQSSGLPLMYWKCSGKVWHEDALSTLVHCCMRKPVD